VPAWLVLPDNWDVLCNCMPRWIVLLGDAAVCRVGSMPSWLILPRRLVLGDWRWRMQRGLRVPGRLFERHRRRSVRRLGLLSCGLEIAGRRRCVHCRTLLRGRRLRSATVPGGEFLSGPRLCAHSVSRWLLLSGLAAQRRHGSVHGRLFLPSTVDRVERRGHVFTRFTLPGRLFRSERLGSM
jgi:hypothetical protein